MVFLTFRIRNLYQKEGDWNPANKQANTTNGSEKYHRAFEGNRTNKQTNGTNGSEEGHKGKRVNGTQQTNKQTQQMGQKNVIYEDLR